MWADVLTRFEVDEHELALLREACRTVDQLDVLAGMLADEGLILVDKPHPALVESRQLRIVLTRLLASLRLPDEAMVRPQRRGAARGAYQAAVTPLRGA